MTASVEYADRFGSLGEISALLGQVRADGSLLVDSWVLSCRAFSRRIEQHTLVALGRELGVERVQFDFAATPRNGLVESFLDAAGATEGDHHLSIADLPDAEPLHAVTVQRTDDVPSPPSTTPEHNP